MAKLSTAFMSLFLDKKARESLKNKPQIPVNPDVPAARPIASVHPSFEEINARLEEGEQAMRQNKSPERQNLIQNALKIRAAQAKVLDDLSDEQKQKLHDLAINSLLAAVQDKGGQ